MLSYAAGASAVWALLNPCFQEHLRLNLSFKAEAIVWAFWGDFFGESWPLHKTPPKSLLMSSL